MNITAKIVIDSDYIIDNISSLDQIDLLESIYNSCDDDSRTRFVKECVDNDLLVKACKYRIESNDICFTNSCKNEKINIILKS